MPVINRVDETGADPIGHAAVGNDRRILDGRTRRVQIADAEGIRRTDIDELLRLLLSCGADPNQRGINDYTPLHMAVAKRNLLAIHVLLEGGADEDNGETLVTEVRIDRRSLVAGLYHGIEGMLVHGMRRLEMAPHLAYGDRGVPASSPQPPL